MIKKISVVDHLDEYKAENIIDRKLYRWRGRGEPDDNKSPVYNRNPVYSIQKSSLYSIKNFSLYSDEYPVWVNMSKYGTAIK